MNIIYKKICYVVIVLTLIVGVAFFLPNVREAVIDAGNTTSHSSSSSSSNSSSSSSHSSSSSYHSSSSSSSSGSYQSLDEMPIFIVMLVFGFISIHWTVFAMLPIAMFLSRGKGNTFKIIVVLEIIRIILFSFFCKFASPGVAITIDFTSLFPIAFIAFPIVVKYDNGKTNNYSNNQTELSDDEYKKINVSDKQTFKDELYKMFEDIEIAWMNFDYDTLKKLCTDGLYNTYKSQLDAYKVKNEKNIMEEIKKINVIPYHIVSDEKVLTLKAIIQIEMKDYIINEKTNEVTSGNKNQVYNNTYDFTFVKNITYRLEKCPGCGEDMTKHKGTTICPYCHTLMVDFDDKWHVSEKKNIRQINK